MPSDLPTIEQSDVEPSASLGAFLGEDLGTSATQLVRRPDDAGQPEGPATPPLAEFERIHVLGQRQRRRDLHALRILPRLEDLPIPQDVRVGEGWTGQMRELADHIGARAALLIVEAFGGQRLSVSRDPDNSPFRGLVSDEALSEIAWVYGGQRIEVPRAEYAVDRAKRAAILAGVRAGTITNGEAAHILATNRTYVINIKAREIDDVAPITLDDLRGPEILRRVATRLVAQLVLAGAPAGDIAAIWTSIFAAVDAEMSALVPPAARSGQAEEGDPGELLLLKRAADAVIVELSAMNIDPGAVDAACGAVLSILDIEEFACAA